MSGDCTDYKNVYSKHCISMKCVFSVHDKLIIFVTSENSVPKLITFSDST